MCLCVVFWYAFQVTAHCVRFLRHRHQLSISSEDNQLGLLRVSPTLSQVSHTYSTSTLPPFSCIFSGSQHLFNSKQLMKWGNTTCYESRNFSPGLSLCDHSNVKLLLTCMCIRRTSPVQLLRGRLVNLLIKVGRYFFPYHKCEVSLSSDNLIFYLFVLLNCTDIRLPLPFLCVVAAMIMFLYLVICSLQWITTTSPFLSSVEHYSHITWTSNCSQVFSSIWTIS